MNGNLFQGMAYFYYDNSSIEKRIEYERGVMTCYTSFYKNGNSKVRVSFKNGKEDGYYYEYFNDGKKKNIVLYDEGEIVREEHYTESGEFVYLFNKIKKRGNT